MMRVLVAIVAYVVAFVGWLLLSAVFGASWHPKVYIMGRVIWTEMWVLNLLSLATGYVGGLVLGSVENNKARSVAGWELAVPLLVLNLVIAIQGGIPEGPLYLVAAYKRELDGIVYLMLVSPLFAGLGAGLGLRGGRVLGRTARSLDSPITPGRSPYVPYRSSNEKVDSHADAHQQD